MDLLENIATELGFQFHLYLVRDELYGAKHLADRQGQFGENAKPTGHLSTHTEWAQEPDWEPANGGLIL